eukprot:1159904-Pelagomonas_calceolata.AAC.2
MVGRNVLAVSFTLSPFDAPNLHQAWKKISQAPHPGSSRKPCRRMQLQTVKSFAIISALPHHDDCRSSYKKLVVPQDNYLWQFCNGSMVYPEHPTTLTSKASKQRWSCQQGTSDPMQNLPLDVPVDFNNQNNNAYITNKNDELA